MLGCFAALDLSKYDLRVALLEAREDVCSGISKANTAIVYSGCDNKPGTLKAELCVRANSRFDALCAALGVRFSRCGSLMTAFGPKGEGKLKRKFEDGLQNKVPGLRLLSGDEAREIEPTLSKEVTLALHAPSTGVVDPFELCFGAFECAKANGAEAFFNCPVTGIEQRNGGYSVNTAQGTFKAKGIVNCAGLAAHLVASMVGECRVGVFPDFADYTVLRQGLQVAPKTVIFSESEEKGKGVTVTPTADGNILIGPSKRKNGLDWETDEAELKAMQAECLKVIPGLSVNEAIRSFGAVRPNPFYLDENGQKSEKSIHSFAIEEGDGFLSLLGVKTPGLTCANELGEYAARKMAEYLHAGANRDFLLSRAAPLRTAELSPDELDRLIKKDSAYGRVICRCGRVTEGEVVDAIRRGATTLDGAKRRTGALMGECQGAVCRSKIVEILARELGIPPEKVRKSGEGSEVLL